MALFPVRQRTLYMPVTQLLSQNTFPETAYLYSLKYTLLATNHIISSRGLVAGEHHNSYMHVQVSQGRPVLPRESHHAGTCCMHIPVQPTTYSRDQQRARAVPNLPAIPQALPSPQLLYQLLYASWKQQYFCSYLRKINGNANINRKMYEKTFDGTVSTIPIGL